MRNLKSKFYHQWKKFVNLINQFNKKNTNKSKSQQIILLLKIIYTALSIIRITVKIIFNR